MYMEVAGQKLETSAERLREIRSLLLREYERLGETGDALRRTEDDALCEVTRYLERQREALYRQAGSAQRLQLALEKAVRLYEQTEESILEEGEGTRRSRPLTAVRMDLEDLQSLMDGITFRF